MNFLKNMKRSFEIFNFIGISSPLKLSFAGLSHIAIYGIYYY